MSYMACLKAASKSFVLFFFAALAVLAHAENRGLAWELSSEDGASKGYLMGAMHLANSSFYPLNPSVLKGFDASSVLMVELDDSRIEPEEQQRLLEKYAYYPEGVSYRDHMSEALADKVEVMFSSLGVEGADTIFARYKPGLLGVTLAAVQAQALGYSVQYGIDSYFLEKGRFHKKIEELESFEFQMSLIAALPSDEESFGDALLNMADFESEWRGLENAWKEGRADELYRLAIGDGLRDFPSLEAYYDLLFFKRNIKMADKIGQCIQTDICFVVVGAGHLVGPNGLVDLLERKGFALKQM
jgi:uncharacterized protein YbaP (TraB family)